MVGHAAIKWLRPLSKGVGLYAATYLLPITLGMPTNTLSFDTKLKIVVGPN